MIALPGSEAEPPCVLTLREADVAPLLSMGTAIDAVREAFSALGRGEIFNQPRIRIGKAGAVLNVMAAVAPAWSAMGVKSYPVVRQDVPQSSTSTFVLYDLPRGSLRAVMEADTLGQRRTGAASAVATQELARGDSRVLTVFGVGWQAEAQVIAVSSALPQLEHVLIVGRSEARVDAFIARMGPLVDVQLKASAPERAVRAADVIVTATGAVEPVLDGSWIKPGTHLNAIGSNHLDRRELDDLTVRRADRIVVDALDVARLECGDLNGVIDWDIAVELGSIVSGRSPGRQADDEITLFESHGLAAEDLACAVAVACRASGGGWRAW